MHVYIVQPGDMLSGVAKQFRLTPERLALANDLPPAPYLLPGHALCIPSELPVTGTDGFFTVEVQPGESLRSLSERWGIPLTWLACCNHLYEGRVQSGDLLLIPRVSSRSPSPQRRLPLAAMEPLLPPTQLTYRLRAGLTIDAAGHLHVAPLPPQQPDNLLLICSLDGAPNILPDVAKAILRSDSAQSQALEEMSTQVVHAGGRGVVFQWPALRPEVEQTYLELVREAGRRLRPLGLVVALHLPSNSPLLRRTRPLRAAIDEIDFVFYEPRKARSRDEENYWVKPPAPLLGLEELHQGLERVEGLFPPTKTWVALRPSAALVTRRQVLQELSPHQALQFAYQQGLPLVHDEESGLARYRCNGGEEGTSVWLEDLWSMSRKLELLDMLKLQGLALWESGAYLPEFWEYIRDEYEHPLADETKKALS